MTDLQTKAMQMALEALDCLPWQASPIAIEATKALRTALAQPEQEPLGSEWVPCVKLPVIVHVRNQRDGETHISTREGITPVLPEDLIMRGVMGEEYPIGRELFERTYTFDVDTVNTSQERVDETAKRGHEPDPCPGCRKGGVCRTPSCGRLKLPVDHPYRNAQAQPERKPLFSIERHGSGWAIYRGRDSFHHGENLGHLTETDEATVQMLERRLNAA